MVNTVLVVSLSVSQSDSRIIPLQTDKSKQDLYSLYNVQHCIPANILIHFFTFDLACERLLQPKHEIIALSSKGFVFKLKKGKIYGITLFLAASVKIQKFFFQLNEHVFFFMLFFSSWIWYTRLQNL